VELSIRDNTELSILVGMRGEVAIQYVYKIINKENGKFYVGRTYDIKTRWKRHVELLKLNKHHSIHFQRAWNKYDKDVWEFKIFKVFDTGNDEEDKCLSQSLEQHFLDTHMSLNILYNRSHSSLTGSLKGKDHPFYNKKPEEWMSEDGWKRTQAYHQKARERKGEENPFFGRHHTEETKQILREKCANFGEKNGFYGKKHTEESIQKMREATLGKYDGENNPFYGKTHTYETKMKISSKLKGKLKGVPKSEETKRKMSLSNSQSVGVTIDGVYYRSFTEAGKALGENRKTIANRVRSKNEKYINYKFANESESVTTIENTLKSGSE
jgi:group I intron endonuclease